MDKTDNDSHDDDYISELEELEMEQEISISSNEDEETVDDIDGVPDKPSDAQPNNEQVNHHCLYIKRKQKSPLNTRQPFCTL